MRATPPRAPRIRAVIDGPGSGKSEAELLKIGRALGETAHLRNLPAMVPPPPINRRRLRKRAWEALKTAILLALLLAAHTAVLAWAA